jgi:hypothetical protein
MHLVLELMWAAIEFILEIVLWVFWENICGWLGSWFLYLVSFGRWNFPNDSIRACVTGLLLVLVVPLVIISLLD